MASANPPTPAITGRCPCNSIRYTSTSPPQTLTYCHCTSCQRLSSAPFIAWADIPSAAFNLSPSSSGALQSLESEIAVRRMCKTCGSAISMQYYCDKSTIGVAAGTIEGGALGKVVAEHIFVREKAGGIDIPDSGGGKRWEGFPRGLEEKLGAWRRGKEEEERKKERP
ncbi:MAG: hypothetical protein LQ338_006010 [Usnochroma carphineum]|nr:MAG: hypothetical protein LQ338_006010 [Usnochroma carphineum]